MPKLLAFIVCALPSPPVQDQPVPRETFPVLELSLGEMGEEIDSARYEDWLLRFQGPTIADRFARAWILDREVQRTGVRVLEEEVRARVDAQIEERIRQAFGGKREPWEREVTAGGQTVEGFLAKRRWQVRQELIAVALASHDRKISPERIRREWEARYGWRGRKMELRWIHLRLANPTPEPGLGTEALEKERELAKQALLARAEELHARIQAGEEFSEIAERESDDLPTRQNGGRFSSGFPHEIWPESALEVLYALSPGEVSAPVFARGGYSLFMIDSFSDTPLETVSNEIEIELHAAPPTADEANAVLELLFQHAAVELLPGLFVAEPAENALRVDGVDVPRADFAAWLRRQQGDLLARTFGEHWTIDRLARDREISVADDEIRRRIDEEIERRILREFQGDRGLWLASLPAEGSSEEIARMALAARARNKLQAEKLIALENTVTPERVRALWESRYGPEGHSTQARMVRKSLPVAARASEGEADELARRDSEALASALTLLADLRRRVQEGEDFGSLARRHSDDPATAVAGGRLPHGLRSGPWTADVALSLEALPIGGLSEPMRIGDACYLIEIVAKRAVSLESVEADLQRELAATRPPEQDVTSFVLGNTRDLDVRVLPSMFR